LVHTDTTAGTNVGVDSSVDPFVMASMVSGVYVVSTTWVMIRLLRSPLFTSPAAHRRPVLGLIGAMMASTFVATVLPNMTYNRRARVYAPEPESESADATDSKSL
jgi:hypothetical protein